MSAQQRHLTPVDSNDLEVYPFGPTDRLDSHYFVPWERRRWLNSDMRLKGDPAARALYLDLIWISYEQSPVGTLPNDMETLAKLTFSDAAAFRRMCQLDYGPLHKWRLCRIGDSDEIRLYHPMVLSTLTEAVSRREDNRARMEAANTHKRLQRLRGALTGYDAQLAKNDAAILWIDEWLNKQGCGYRSSNWIEQGIQAWSNHMFDLRRKQAGGGQ